MQKEKKNLVATTRASKEGFPGCINTSVNDVAVHGVPGKQKLKRGDVLSIDAGMLLDGYAGDSTLQGFPSQVLPKYGKHTDSEDGQ